MNENRKVERLKIVDDRSLFIDQLHRWRKILKSLFLPNELFFRINLNKKSYIFPELTFFNELFKNDLKTNQFKFLLNDWKKNKMGRTTNKRSKNKPSTPISIYYRTMAEQWQPWKKQHFLGFFLNLIFYVCSEKNWW